MSNFKASWQTYKRLLKQAKQYWGIFVIGMIGTIGLSMTDAAFSWMVKPLINQGFVARDKFFISLLPILIIVVFIVRGVAGFTSSYFISRVSRNVVRDFRRRLFAKYLKIPATYYDQHSSGFILSKIIYNVEQVATATSDALLTLLRETSLFIGLITVMFLASWRLSLLFVVVSPFIACVVKWSSKRMRRLSGNVQQSVGEVTHVADESIQGYKVIRLFGGQQYETQKFFQVTRANQQRELKIVVTNSVGTSLVQFLIGLPIGVTLILATMPSMHVTAGAFASIITAMVMILRPVRRLTNVNSEIQKGIAGAESLFAVIDEPEEIDKGNFALERVRGEIQYKNVHFGYDKSNGQPVLKEINFTAHAGQTVAIVGRSGSGKSTLINLLPRFYEITGGEITIDGVNIADYQLENLRSHFALVSQHTTLFNDTIANNIAYGFADKIDRQQIIHAATLANAMEFIQNLPNGLDTVVGEDGVLLSGGQRQRIAIARALLKKASILILDEATASLDSHSEKQIQNALDTLMHQQTTLVIAHRLSTIENADWIIVMDEGRIIEQGAHDELYAMNGAYAALHRIQFSDSKTANLV